MITRRNIFGMIAGLAAAPVAATKRPWWSGPRKEVLASFEPNLELRYNGKFWCACGKRANDMYRLIAFHDGKDCVRLADAEFTNVEEMGL